MSPLNNASKREAAMTLKRKINIKLITLTALTILVCAVLCTKLFYELFEKEVIKELKTYVHTISGIDNIKELEAFIDKAELEDIRVTVINDDGHVDYDSYTDSESMNNHKDRPEIIEAKDKGEGQSIRKSDTFGKSTFYYAILLPDGNILRVSKEAKSIMAIFMSTLPAMLLILLLLWGFCIILSHFLTKSIVAPIEKLSDNLDSDTTISTYKELEPVVERISTQHKDIIKGAKMRQEFTANVSHELKTPLTAISGYSEIIQNGMADEEDTKRFAGEIHKNSDRLLSLINDIIKLSSLDFKTTDEVSMEKLNLAEMARSCVDTLSVTASKSNVNMHFEGESAYVTGNREMIEELLVNVCGNAIRYNKPNGDVYVSVKHTGSRQQGGVQHGDCVELSIRDTGIGIPKEDLDRVFERFYRVDKSRSKSTGGTGLGLAIVKHIIAQHPNAVLTLDSELNVGTCVKVTFNENI